MQFAARDEETAVAFRLGGKIMDDSGLAFEDQGMLRNNSHQLVPIDPKRARFPCCVVWTPLPLISWLLPFIGHIGICREDGVILDFAGPNFVCVDHFAFGKVKRYVRISREELDEHVFPIWQCRKLTDPSGGTTWDDALRKGTQEFQHRSYSLFTCNCHSFVANNLNRLEYHDHDGWNVVNVAAFIFLKGTWVDKTAIVKTYLPFLIVLCIGVFLGGSNFLLGVLAFSVALIGWFLIGTYCFKSLIEL